MFFYDAFSFIQVTFMLFIVIGLGLSAFLATDSAVVRRSGTVPRRLLPVRPRRKRPRNRLAWATLGVLAVLALAAVTAVMATHDFGSNGKPGAGASAKPVPAVSNRRRVAAATPSRPAPWGARPASLAQARYEADRESDTPGTVHACAAHDGVS